MVLDSGAKLAMDGRGAWRDKVLVERRWRSVKYEHVYKCAYASVSDARSKIAGYLDCGLSGLVQQRTRARRH